jgi:diguanylate cyclase (GGDEF)-like protein
MENPTRQPTASGAGQNVARGAAGLHVRGRLLGVIAVTSISVLALLAAAFTSGSAVASASGQTGGRALAVVTAMLVLGGAFVILRAAISHDDCSRRFDGLHQELESSNARLKEFSFTDDVTGLYNRRFFETRLADEVSRYSRFNQPLSVVMLDIDGFKAVNDDLGHAAGDETLRIIGHILRTQSRNIDVICRYGGDEFAVLLVETGKDGALLYADRVRRQIEAAGFGHRRAITVSLGVACLPEDVGPVPEDVIIAADWALYEAKRAGKNQVAGRDGAIAIGKGRRGGWDL